VDETGSSLYIGEAGVCISEAESVCGGVNACVGPQLRGVGWGACRVATGARRALQPATSGEEPPRLPGA
jgi:hypothetical protein